MAGLIRLWRCSETPRGDCAWAARIRLFIFRRRGSNHDVESSAGGVAYGRGGGDVYFGDLSLRPSPAAPALPPSPPLARPAHPPHTRPAVSRPLLSPSFHHARLQP